MMAKKTTDSEIARDFELARIEAEYILEKIMRRINHTGITRDLIASRLIELIDKTGGDFRNVGLTRIDGQTDTRSQKEKKV